MTEQHNGPTFRPTRWTKRLTHGEPPLLTRRSYPEPDSVK